MVPSCVVRWLAARRTCRGSHGWRRADIYTEPSDVDVHTLRNLGPLRGMAGIWEGSRSLDVNPKAAGPQSSSYAIVGALALYLDFANLFLFLLRFTGSRRDSE